ncbi:MAG TPA: kelch repeat-containing protein [Bryobacteraceae bacterium]|nr:kelch repeat-containing protein [Bryobacteraceae bacterium]
MKISFVLLLVLLASPDGAKLLGQSAGTFTPAGSMTTPRVGHTATLLYDRKVLIAGGENASWALLSSTETYDTATQTFTPSGNMTVARSGHTATLLADGRVLIVGGDSVGSAEIYDPVTGNFTATGDLLAAPTRTGFNATLLANGKVLITGGFVGYTDSGYVIGDAELYDPATGMFTAAGSYSGSLASLDINIGGFGSTSTLLPDGTVLFATEPAAQVYDPVSAAFSVRGTMFVASVGGGSFAPDYIVDQTATLLLNGKVLTAGGEQEDAGRFNTAELYDAASGLFIPTGSMVKARDGHTATLLPDGSALMAGGDSQTCEDNGCWASGIESSAELYDPVKGTFTEVGNMISSRTFHTATLLNNGDVLIAGGLTDVGPEPVGGFLEESIASAELYHPASPLSAPVLFSMNGNGTGQGAVWDAATGQLASPQNPATASEILSMYVSGLAEGGAIPPQVTVGGQMAQILFFGDAPGYPGYYQVNFRVPSGVAPGSAVPVRLNYLNRTSNEVSIRVQ